MDFVELEFSAMALELGESTIRTVTQAARDRRAEGHDVVTLAGGLPDDSLIGINAMSIDGEDVELKETMNYHPGIGVKSLLTKLQAFQREVHGSTEHAVAVTNGNTDALLKIVELLTNPGEAVLTEELSWPGFLTQLSSRRRSTEAVAMDDRGPIPEALDAAAARLPGRRKLFYTVPSGHNPTGITVDEERKRAIYAVCRDRNVVILEDDPYYFISFGKRRLPSYLSLDVDGRVIRLDSTAKIVAPGLRLGWLSAAPAFVRKFQLLAQMTTMVPPGLSQAAFEHILDGDFFGRVDKLAADYERRRDLFHKLLEENLAGKAAWALPPSGMFFWLKIHGCADAADLLRTFVDAGVALVPGRCFDTNNRPSPYVRLSFAYGSDGDLAKGVRRIASVLADIHHDP